MNVSEISTHATAFSLNNDEIRQFAEDRYLGS